MAARKRRNVSRLLDPRWGNVGGEMRLFDRAGREWTLANEQLDVETARRLYQDPDVPVAVAEGGGGPTWIDPPDRPRRWADDLQARTFDASWKPPHDAPGALPFEALEFGSDGDRLLLFFDAD